MSRSDADRAQHNYISHIEQVARMISSSRSPSGVLQRILQFVGETLGAQGGAVVLGGEFAGRLTGVSWGTFQDDSRQLGQELLDGVTVDSTPTARHTTLSRTSHRPAIDGTVLAAPILGLQQAIGVMVLFEPAASAIALDTDLALLHAIGLYLGLYLQTTMLREQVKILPQVVHGRQHRTANGYDPDRMVGDSPAMHAVLQQLQQAARSRSTVLLRGESGTGKELGARALHKLSDRSEQAFVKLNCAALPENLLESELFGHERGAFTGAVRMRRGRFEVADKGTLFLDEIGDISLAMQVKLLRVLQERTFERVGGSRSIEVDVRIIAATHVNLEEAVRQGRFREDLYYRLHVVPIVLPSLRERREDIPLLVGYFLRRFNEENSKDLKISSAAMDLIVSYDWPGNVRELENCVERMVVMARRDIIAPEDVPLPVNLTRPYAVPNAMPRAPMPIAMPAAASLPGAVADIERQRVVEALQRCGGVQTRAASILGITPRQLGYRLKKYSIDPKQIL
jgi:Nif-specific regulatory protein